MAITGTIKEITPRWLRAAPGVLVQAVGRVAIAAVHGLMRATGQVSAVAGLEATARRRRRSVPDAIGIVGSLSAVARRLRRAVPEAVQAAGALSATARLRRRSTPEAVQAYGKISITPLLISSTANSAGDNYINSAGDSLVTHS